MTTATKKKRVVRPSLLLRPRKRLGVAGWRLVSRAQETLEELENLKFFLTKASEYERHNEYFRLLGRYEALIEVLAFFYPVHGVGRQSWRAWEQNIEALMEDAPN